MGLRPLVASPVKLPAPPYLAAVPLIENELRGAAFTARMKRPLYTLNLGHLNRRLTKNNDYYGFMTSSQWRSHD